MVIGGEGIVGEEEEKCEERERERERGEGICVRVF